MNKAVSEQLPNDGSHHVKRLVEEANDRLRQIGRQGKRATIVAKKTSLTLQFTFNDGEGRSQKQVGLGAISLSQKGIQEAERIAEMVTHQLVAGTFTWDWFNALIGKDTSEKTQLLTCKEMLEVYKKHYFRQKKGIKSIENSWYSRCRHIEETLANEDSFLSSSLIWQIINRSENNSDTRRKMLNGLAGFLKHFNNNDFKSIVKQCKEDNNPKSQKRNVPTDDQIIGVYKTGFLTFPECQKRYFERHSRWQFLFGLLATYGLRVHEAWNIANWDKPVILKDGDWVAVDVDDDADVLEEHKGDEVIVPAILDPSNTEYILCIKHNTKTGYRMVMPLCPTGHDWIKEFNLLQPLNLPDIKNPLKRVGKNKTSFACSGSVCRWFKSHKYGFKPHDLRHAYNIRGHHLGINPKALSDSSGHSLIMSGRTYLRHMKDILKHRALKESIAGVKKDLTELELLREENEALNTENQDLKKENNLLKTKLKMYEAIAESKNQK